MRKFLTFSIVSALIVTGAFALFKISNKYKIDILSEEIEYDIVGKGYKGAKSICTDGADRLFIAYSDYIKVIDGNGNENILYRDNSLNIEDLVYSNEKLYFTSGDKLISLSIKNKIVENILLGIPSSYKNSDRRLLVDKESLYLSIPSATNSGITTEKGIYDKYPVDVILSGVNYGPSNTGAFLDLGVSSENGQKIKGEIVGNASVLKIDLNNNKVDLFASGLRCISGFDKNSEEEIMAIVTGMDNEGERPVNKDKDYIYFIEENDWYGWPDFSGGEPINSPRFKGKEIIKPLIKDSTKSIIKPPKYQYTKVDAIKELAVDKNGSVLEKNSYLIWEKNEQMICAINEDNVFYRILKLNEKSIIEDIVYDGENFLILDSSIGCIYNIHENSGMLGFKLPEIVWAFILTLSIVLLYVVVIKITKRKNNISNNLK